jgi:hypothetical protein
MAASLSDLTSAIRSKPLEEYDWWKHHVTFFAGAFIAFPTILMLSPQGIFGGLWRYLGIADLVRQFLNACLLLLAATLIVTWVGSLLGYYYDAKYLETLDIDYSPHWPLYTILHLTFGVGAFLAVPIYSIQRLRHVGIPMFAEKRL